MLAKRLFSGSMAGAALAYLGKTWPYDLCPEYDNYEHIGSRCDQICNLGEDTEDQECLSSLDIWDDWWLWFSGRACRLYIKKWEHYLEIGSTL